MRRTGNATASSLITTPSTRSSGSRSGALAPTSNFGSAIGLNIHSKWFWCANHAHGDADGGHQRQRGLAGPARAFPADVEPADQDRREDDRAGGRPLAPERPRPRHERRALRLERPEQDRSGTPTSAMAAASTTSRAIQARRGTRECILAPTCWSSTAPATCARRLPH